MSYVLSHSRVLALESNCAFLFEKSREGMTLINGHSQGLLREETDCNDIKEERGLTEEEVLNGVGAGRQGEGASMGSNNSH